MSDVDDQTPIRPIALIGTFVVLSGAYFACTIIYNLSFHPLAKIPGPWVNKISRIPYIRHLLAGTTVHNTTYLHEKYGPVVRITPGDVSFTSVEEAWPQIYGFRTGTLKGHRNHPKDVSWLGPRAFDAENVLRAHEEDHGRQRKLLSHAFSERSLIAQESLMQDYVDKFISQLKTIPATTGETIDIVEWYNWTTFDIIGDLLFGESFGNLDDLHTHEHIHNLFHSLKSLGQAYLLNHFPALRSFSKLFLDESIPKNRAKYLGWVGNQVEKRMAKDTDRPDFMSMILQHNGQKGLTLSINEVKSNSVLLIGAGSETTATLLSGATWLLLKNPEIMQKLKDEVRGRWKDYEDITLHEVGKAPYLQAVLNEALRYYPPVPTGFPRSIAQGGEMVSGYFIPEKTSVYVSSYAAHHSTRNFADPEKFDPERWLGGNEKYANDKLTSIQPFSFGPHSCLGKNLAHGEMRVILAKLIWSFDLVLDASAEDWLDRCRVFTLWEKAPLSVRVKEAQR